MNDLYFEIKKKRNQLPQHFSFISAINAFQIAFRTVQTSEFYTLTMVTFHINCILMKQKLNLDVVF